MEGKILHKFDMKPHKEYIQDYSKLCRERTNKYMTRTRQIQVIVAFKYDLCVCVVMTFGFFSFIYSASFSHASY